MKLGVVVNDMRTEWPLYTTTHLAMAASGMGHHVWYIEVGSFALRTNDRTYAAARPVPHRTFRSDEVFLRTLRSVPVEHICVDDLDVLLLRNNPNDDTVARPWARIAGIDFGLLAAQSGVIVLNDPAALARSLTKLYLHSFPEDVRPRTLVTRDRNEAKAFIAEEGGCAVIKPLFGYGGRNVFLVRPDEGPNVNQMFEAVAREGYVIVQEYLPTAAQGDTRVFLMNAAALRCKGRIAAVARTRTPGDPDMRSNLTAGGVVARANVNDEILALTERLGPRLIEDGIFLAGIDVAGGKVMEVNIMTPGTLRHAEMLEGVNFSRTIIRALERKVDHLLDSAETPSNVELATW